MAIWIFKINNGESPYFIWCSFWRKEEWKAYPKAKFYQSASLLDVDIVPQNTPREKQSYGNLEQELIGFDSLLDASISGSLGPLEQKQAIENEFQKPQNTFSVSEKL